mmetsp:Transcript_96968/g.257660  ORF Transcript_96968/g.257660 Transcript_96968/m.257660 type:complete len:256 (+) Transcript_96968:1575-2342(+)
MVERAPERHIVRGAGDHVQVVAEVLSYMLAGLIARCVQEAVELRPDLGATGLIVADGLLQDPDHAEIPWQQVALGQPLGVQAMPEHERNLLLLAEEAKELVVQHLDAVEQHSRGEEQGQAEDLGSIGALGVLAGKQALSVHPDHCAETFHILCAHKDAASVGVLTVANTEASRIGSAQPHAPVHQEGLPPSVNPQHRDHIERRDLPAEVSQGLLGKVESLAILLHVQKVVRAIGPPLPRTARAGPGQGESCRGKQ